MLNRTLSFKSYYGPNTCNLFRNSGLCRDFASYTLRVFLFVILGENAASEMSFKPEFIRIAPPLYQCEDEVWPLHNLLCDWFIVCFVLFHIFCFLVCVDESSGRKTKN